MEFLTPLKFIFVLSFLLRIFCLPLIARIQERKVRGVNDILNQMKSLRVASLFVSLYNITDYTSKIVLLPQKQFFILQRKTVFRMRRDLKNIQNVIVGLTKSIGNITKKNIKYHVKKIKGQEEILEKQIGKLEYAEGTQFTKIPQQALDKVRSLGENLAEGKVGVISESKEVQKAVENYEEKLEKEYKKELFLKKEKTEEKSKDRPDVLK